MHMSIGSAGAAGRRNVTDANLVVFANSWNPDKLIRESMKARSLSWGHEGQGPGYKETDLKSSPCTPQQLGLVEEENENTLFYAPHSRSKSTLE